MKKNESENCHKGHRENVRRRFLTGGLEVFAPHEILELLLFYSIPQKDTNPIAHRLIDKYGNLFNVLSAPIEDLQTVEGVGEQTAILLSLVFQLTRWIRLDTMRGAGVNFLSAKEAGQYCREMFSGQQSEEVCELCLNRRGDLIGQYSMTNGNIVSVSMDIRTLISNAVLSHADAVLLAHNHPHGDANPSEEDCAATRYIREALAKVNIPLLDHIIVGEHDVVSMREAGFLD
ncbi:MAG: DNA repair protein RadC [Oscillibacter sp.]|nr:DNA repair protein RadC [Oscillibacter sp.]